MPNDIHIPEDAMTEEAWEILIDWAHGEAKRQESED